MMCWINGLRMTRTSAWKHEGFFTHPSRAEKELRISGVRRRSLALGEGREQSLWRAVYLPLPRSAAVVSGGGFGDYTNQRMFVLCSLFDELHSTLKVWLMERWWTLAQLWHTSQCTNVLYKYRHFHKVCYNIFAILFIHGQKMQRYQSSISWEQILNQRIWTLCELTGSVSVRLSFHTSSKATTISWSSSRDRTPSRSTSNTLKQTGNKTKQRSDEIQM